MIGAVDVTLANESCAFGVSGKLLIGIWRDSPKEKGIWTREQIANLASRDAQDVFFLIVLQKDVTLPSPEARQAIANALTEFSAMFAAIAIVFEGQGFFAAAIKSAATNIIMLFGSRIPFRACSSLEEAYGFFRACGGAGVVDFIQIQSAVSHVRGSIREPASKAVGT